MKVTEKDREIEVQPCILCDELEQLEMIWKQRGNGYIECGCCGLKGPKAEGIIGATREWNSLHGRVAAAYARGLEDAAKVAESGDYLEHELAAAIRKLGKGA